MDFFKVLICGYFYEAIIRKKSLKSYLGHAWGKAFYYNCILFIVLFEAVIWMVPQKLLNNITFDNNCSGPELDYVCIYTKRRIGWVRRGSFWCKRLRSSCHMKCAQDLHRRDRQQMQRGRRLGYMQTNVCKRII